MQQHFFLIKKADCSNSFLINILMLNIVGLSAECINNEIKIILKSSPKGVCIDFPLLYWSCTIFGLETYFLPSLFKFVNNPYCNEICVVLLAISYMKYFRLMPCFSPPPQPHTHIADRVGCCTYPRRICGRGLFS